MSMRNPSKIIQLFVGFSGRRPQTSRGCCTSPDQMQASRCRSRVRPALQRPPRARNTRRDVTRTLGIKLVTSPTPIRWRGKTRLQFHPCHPWRCPLRLRRLARRIKEPEHSRSGNDGNWFPARPRTGRDTSEYPRGRSNRMSKNLDEPFSLRTRFKTVLLKVKRTDFKSKENSARKFVRMRDLLRYSLRIVSKLALRYDA